MRIQEPRGQVGEIRLFGDKSSFGLEFQIIKDASTSDDLTRANMDRECCPLCSGCKPNLDTQRFLEASQGAGCAQDNNAYLLVQVLHMGPFPSGSNCPVV